jgi:adenosylmethionine-8-amino-7-oxononanoate aminotransferase
VFFTESGSVAVEVALKMAIQYWRNKGQAAKQRIVCFRHGYHGDTFATMALCDPGEGMHTLFAGSMPEQIMAELPADAVHAPRLRPAAGNPGRARRRRDRRTAGAGRRRHEDARRGDPGLHRRGLPAPRGAADRRRDHDRLRPQRKDVRLRGGRRHPDILCLSKALTGGTLPLAATVARRHVFEAFLSDDPGAALMHGPTYMANPLACAAANASLDLFEREPRLEQVAAIEAQLRAELEPCRAIAGVADVRVKGAIGAVELAGTVDLDAMRRRFPELGVWVRPFGRIVYLMPPFVIDPADLSTLTGAVRRVLAERAATL